MQDLTSTDRYQAFKLVFDEGIKTKPNFNRAPRFDRELEECEKNPGPGTYNIPRTIGLGVEPYDKKGWVHGEKPFKIKTYNNGVPGPGEYEQTSKAFSLLS
jgi:Sperm-tail PG-rich repeat